MFKTKISSFQQNQNSPGPLAARILNLIDASPSRAIGIILIVGVLLSTVSMASHPPSVQSGETDSWWMIALNLVNGRGYSLCLTRYFPLCGPSNELTAMREPFPVFLFAGTAWLGKQSLWAAALLEALVYLAIVIVIYLLTREWSDSRSAVIASFLWAIYLPALELIPQVSGDLVAALCTAIGILFTVKAQKTRQTLDWILAGAGLGLAILSRSATLVVAVVIIGGQIVAASRQGLRLRSSIRPILLLSGCLILSIAPWLLRNQLVLGRFILGSSLTSYNLYRHNQMINRDHYFRYVGPQEGLQAIKELIARTPNLYGNENEAEMDLVYREAAFQVIKSHPAQYVLVSAYRVFPLWFDWKIAEAYGRVTNRYGYFIMICQALLLALALAGIRTRARMTWPLWGSVLIISLAYMAVDARLLYVMPVMPLVISLSAAGANKLFLVRFLD